MPAVKLLYMRYPTLIFWPFSSAGSTVYLCTGLSSTDRAAGSFRVLPLGTTLYTYSVSPSPPSSVSTFV